MYFVLKLVHVLAVIVFVGNIVTGIFWKTIADKTKDAAVMAHTMEGIIRADRVFTIPAIIVLLIGGFGTAAIGNISILGTGWILWSIILFIIAGLAFMPLLRAQRAIAAEARKGVAAGKLDWVQYEALSRAWNMWGIIATAAPLIAVAVMVLKPDLPSFHR